MKITTNYYEVETAQDIDHPSISYTVITRLIDGRVLHCDLPIARIGEQLMTLDNYLNGYMDVVRYPLQIKANDVNPIFNELFNAISGFNQARQREQHS